MRIHELAPELVEKVRAAAGARLRSSLRLKDRVRHRIGGGLAPVRPRSSVRAPSAPRPVAATGSGLVLVGVSTGGPPALETLLTALPQDFPWPILIAQHMPATFTGPLAARLDKLCAITVVEVSRPVLLEPGCAYIGRGDADLLVSRRAAGLTALAAPSQAHYPWHPSADRLVRSALDHVPATQLVGLLMTGMGNDGAEAMKRLREGRGRTIAEAESTAIVWGMPGELVKNGGAEMVKALDDIAATIIDLVSADAPC
jgi:two-component system chemotaxis response regulator CheB